MITREDPEEVVAGGEKTKIQKGRQVTPLQLENDYSTIIPVK